MKIPSLLVALLLLMAGRLAAAPVENTELWITPQAQAIRDRVIVAYSALEGWTANMVSEDITIRNGVETRNVTYSSERYLRSGGPVGYYAATTRSFNDTKGYARCQDLTSARQVSRNVAKLSGTRSPASEDNRPALWVSFESSLAHTDHVRWVGRETIAGQSCDVVEFLSLRRKAPGDPVTGIVSARYYINAAGLIERVVDGWDGQPGATPYSSDTRITYDAKAKLTPADFSSESFQRDAAGVLKGDPMPVLEEQLFAAGDHLPDMAFVGWSDGKLFRPSDFRGKVVVLETWASWCHYCKEAFPFYEKMRQALAYQGVVFVAVSFDAKLADYEKWMKEHGGEYGFKFGRVDSPDPAKAMKDFRGSLPAFYVLGRDGKIVSSYIGYGYGRGGEDPRLLAALRAAGVKIQ